ncbi:pimeloyl-ACP methyl ester carboxylesterase [Catenulispora sp. GAS73]|uniref:alpha/beta hydrolase n=1 Tax=Catenulispora sp. GAS73 TaxID=3156269 RepID=UPI0035120502
MRRNRVLWALGAVAALFVTAVPTAGAASTRPDPLAGFGRQTLTWQACGTAQCSTLTVPRDYLDPAGQVFHLPVIKFPATDPAHRVGTLFANLGGAANSGVGYLRGSLTYALSPRLLADFDVVTWDARGTAGSDPALRCPGAALDAYFAVDPTTADVGSLMTAGRAYADGCRTASAPGLPGRLGSLVGAFDADVLRSALGEKKISYFGESYGTLGAAWYAELFPAHLRSVVLDAFFNPDQSGQQMVVDQSRAAETEIGYYESVRGNGALIDSLFARLRTSPLPVPGTTATVGPNALSTALSIAVVQPEQTWPLVDDALAKAAAGDGSGLYELAQNGRLPDGSYYPTIYQGQALECADWWWPTTRDGYAAMRAAAEAAGPDLGALQAQSGLPCTAWAPPTSAPLPLTAAGSPPILVVATTGDPDAPYQWGVSAARTFQHGVLLTFQGHGHTAYMRGNSCVDDAIDTDLINGTPPAAGTVC